MRSQSAFRPWGVSRVWQKRQLAQVSSASHEHRGFGTKSGTRPIPGVSAATRRDRHRRGCRQRPRHRAPHAWPRLSPCAARHGLARALWPEGRCGLVGCQARVRGTGLLTQVTIYSGRYGMDRCYFAPGDTDPSTGPYRSASLGARRWSWSGARLLSRPGAARGRH
jgi:hypothetical protein